MIRIIPSFYFYSKFQVSITSILVCVGVSMFVWLRAIIVPTAIGFAFFVFEPAFACLILCLSLLGLFSVLKII